MAKFNIKIVKDNGDVDIYTDPHNVIVNDETIKVDFEDQSVDHDPDQIEEIIIKPNR